MISLLYHQRTLDHQNNEKMNVTAGLQLLALLLNFLHQIDIIHRLEMVLDEPIFHYY